MNREELRKRLNTYNLSRPVVDQMIRYGHLQDLRAGRVLVYQKDLSPGCYYVLEGRINRIQYLSDESSVKVGTLEAGQWGGVVELLIQVPALTDLVVEERSLLLMFSPADFHQMQQEVVFKDDLLKVVSRENVRLHRNQELNTPRARIIRLLMEASYPDRSFTLNITQDQIARDAGTTRETVNRFLKDLERLGVISLGRGQLTIDDWEGLESRQF